LAAAKRDGRPELIKEEGVTPMPNVLGSSVGTSFQTWLRRHVRNRGEVPQFPQTKSEIAAHKQAVRAILQKAAGPIPTYEPLAAEIHQVHKRDGYRIEAVSFPTFAGLRMTANAYVPDVNEPVPGILAVHGHSAHARRDTQTQQRCTALAKLGYFVLAVDAIGNGERSTELPGSYHGGNEAAALLLTGYSVFGIQLYENYRACDYLISRPEVDASRLAISGASGGGNQSFYSGAWDDRFTAVVPVCSTGAYRKMIGTHNCMCETPFGVAGNLEQYDIMATIAPRALLVISARVDNFSFRFEDAQATMTQAARVWGLIGCPEKVAFEGLPIQHGYPPVAREVALGWFSRWLKGAEDATPVIEPAVQIEDYATISCYPLATSPQVMTLPTLFTQKRKAVTPEGSEPGIDDVRELFGTPSVTTLEVEPITRLPGLTPGSTGVSYVFQADNGMVIPSITYWPDYSHSAQSTLLMVGDSKDDLTKNPLARQALLAGSSVWIVDLPGLGESRLPGEIGEYIQRVLSIRGSVSAFRACHLLGLSLGGLWIGTVQSLFAQLSKTTPTVSLAVAGGPATIFLAGAGLFDGFERLTIFNPLGSYRLGERFFDLPYESFIPRLLRVGDIPDLAALAAPNPLTVVAPVAQDGTPLAVDEAARVFTPVRKRYEAYGKPQAFHLVGAAEATSLVLSELTT
jgi:dienelactone hydrolase